METLFLFFCVAGISGDDGGDDGSDGGGGSYEGLELRREMNGNFLAYDWKCSSHFFAKEW